MCHAQTRVHARAHTLEQTNGSNELATAAIHLLFSFSLLLRMKKIFALRSLKKKLDMSEGPVTCTEWLTCLHMHWLLNNIGIKCTSEDSRNQCTAMILSANS